MGNFLRGETINQNDCFDKLLTLSSTVTSIPTLINNDEIKQNQPINNINAINNPNSSLKWSDDFTKVNNQLIGKGVFGKVWIVRRLNKPTQQTTTTTSTLSDSQIKNDKNNSEITYFAMKEIDLDNHVLKQRPKNLSYALDEGKKMQNLNHKNVIAYLNSYHDPKVKKFYLITEYASGCSLRDRMNLQRNKKDYYKKQNYLFNEDLIWYWLLQILEGIKFIHSNDIIHRDIKPDNIFIDARNGQCKLGDFGLAKILVETAQQDNISLVGTHPYMPPEVLDIIRAQQGYFSMETVEKKIEICLEYNKIGDIYSLGCTIYELVLLPYKSSCENSDNSSLYSEDLQEFMRQTLNKNPRDRPSIKQLYELNLIKKRLKNDYSSAYYDQIIPTLNLASNFKSSFDNSSYLDIDLCNEYKPSVLITTKYKSNLILISLNRHMNKQKKNNSTIFKTLSAFTIFALTTATNNSELMNDTKNEDYEYIDETETYNNNNNNSSNTDDIIEQSKIVIYTEFGELVNEIDCFYLDNERQVRKGFYFQILGMCIDEENSHLYVSINLKPSQIYRFCYVNNSFSYLVLDGVLDLNEVNQMRPIGPTCLHLLSSIDITKRILLFGDRLNKCLTSLAVQLNSIEKNIKCNSLRSVTLDTNLYATQILTTNNEIICLLNNLSTIQIYDLNNYLLLRDNKEDTSYTKLVLNCLCIDSDYNIYTTNGHSFFCINKKKFKFSQKFKPQKQIEPECNYFESISFMSILSNGKLILVKDAIQNENSKFYILKPEFVSK